MLGGGVDAATPRPSYAPVPPPIHMDRRHGVNPTASPIVHASAAVVVAAPAVVVAVEDVDTAAVPTYEYNVQF